MTIRLHCASTDVRRFLRAVRSALMAAASAVALAGSTSAFGGEPITLDDGTLAAAQHLEQPANEPVDDVLNGTLH